MAPFNWLRGSVSQLARPAHLPSIPPPAGEVDLKFEQLCRAEVNLPAALGGGCGTEKKEAERRTADMKLCRTFLGTYYRLVLTSQLHNSV